MFTSKTLTSKKKRLFLSAFHFVHKRVVAPWPDVTSFSKKYFTIYYFSERWAYYGFIPREKWFVFSSTDFFCSCLKWAYTVRGFAFYTVYAINRNSYLFCLNDRCNLRLFEKEVDSLTWLDSGALAEYFTYEASGYYTLVTRSVCWYYNIGAQSIVIYLAVEWRTLWCVFLQAGH